MNAWKSQPPSIQQQQCRQRDNSRVPMRTLPDVLSSLLSAFLLSAFLLSPFPLSAQYTQIFDPFVPAIEKMLVFDDTLYGIPGTSSGSPGPLLYSTDLGASWRSYTSSLDWLDADVSDIAATHTHMYVLTDRGLFRKSTAEGAFRWVTRVTGTTVVPSGSELHILDASTEPRENWTLPPSSGDAGRSTLWETRRVGFASINARTAASNDGIGRL